MKGLAEVLAFDLGAGSGRAMIGRLLEDGGVRRLQIEEIHRFPNEQIRIGQHLHWNILHIVEQLKEGFRKAFEKGNRPQSFGIDTWGVDFGLLDRNGELIGIPYSYRDPQTEGLIEELHDVIGREELYAQSGLQFMPFNTIYQLYAMRKRNSPKLDIAETLLFMPDLLTYLLTGCISCEYTIATTSALFHPGEKTWNKPLMRRLGIPSHMFVDPVQPGERIGKLSQEVCTELEIPAIDAVAAATHDTESAIVAVPALEEPFAYLVSGTWSLFGTEMPGPVVTPEALALQFSNEGGAGGTTQLLKNIMGMWILEECRREWTQDGHQETYAELIRQAEEAEPFRSLINPEDLRFFSPGGMTGKIRQFCRESGQPEPRTRGEFVRCILESLAFKYREVLEQAEKLTGLRFQVLHMVGGGVRNELVCRFTAEALGRKVIAGPVEASSIGNVLIQLIHAGYLRDLREARRLVSDSFDVKVYEPAAPDAWQSMYKRYQGLISR